MLIDAHGPNSKHGHGTKNHKETNEDEDTDKEESEVDTEKINNIINIEKAGFNNYNIQG